MLIVKVVTDAPEFGHAEIVVRPKPAPRDVRTTVRARAAKAPANIAAQTDGRGRGFVTDSRRPPVLWRPLEPCPWSVPDQREKNDDRNWHAEQPEQNTTTHNCFLQFLRRLLTKASLADLFSRGLISLDRYEFRRKPASPIWRCPFAVQTTARIVLTPYWSPMAKLPPSSSGRLVSESPFGSEPRRIRIGLHRSRDRERPRPATD